MEVIRLEGIFSFFYHISMWFRDLKWKQNSTKFTEILFIDKINIYIQTD